ncbi:ABC transporter permease [Acrocarpospora catenulata]|uniref:ABC transporter permease n=1 Tax=Acrocarpospora catenulata TaxID=2836182 RepID=UPI001BDB1A51|nr:ABC transporter permease [Acrocarpospora catenulata]
MIQPIGVIHDIGYRHYDGPRLGRGYATTALALNSLRGVFGLGRAARAKIMPFLIAGTMLLPAVVSIAVMALLKERPLAYPGYAVTMQAVLAIFVAAQSPYLVAPDLRFRVLPLYLSRPITSLDYVAAKLVAMIAALYLLLALPLTLMYLGELLIDLDGPPHTGDYFAALGGGLVCAVTLAVIGVAIASFTPRRGLGVAAVIAFYMFTLAASAVFFGVLLSEGHETAAEWSILINPFFLVDAVQVNLFGTEAANGQGYPPGAGPAVITAGVIALALGALVLRYRKAAAA